MMMTLHQVNAISRLIEMVPQLTEFAMVHEQIAGVGLEERGGLAKLPTVKWIEFPCGLLELKRGGIATAEGRQDCYELSSNGSHMVSIAIPMSPGEV